MLSSSYTTRTAEKICNMNSCAIFPLAVLLFSRSLSENGIGDEGAAALGKALEVNTKLTTLK